MIQPIKLDRDIYRGPQPQTDDDWKELQRLGIKYTLDLETGSHFLKDGSPLEEAFTAETYGIKVFSHPLGEILPPSKAELNLAHRTMDKFKPIYVHCKAGVDRTGMVCAYHEWDNGFTKAQAIARMKSFGMHFWYYWWTWFL
jgi:protein tyrosine/serine phosphatase